VENRFMAELNVSISETSHKALLSLSEDSGETIQAVLDKAIETYRRQIFLEKANQAFATLRQNETLWREELAERQAWDQTVADGIEE
jgi:hypothetical protein